MTYCFDQLIERRSTHSNKWDDMGVRYGLTGPDAIPMWVADMDFRPPQAVTEALAARVAHGVHGYYGDDTSFLRALSDWQSRRHGWPVDPSWVMHVDGLVNGTALCVQAFTQPGEAVILFTPVYHAFARVIRAGGREVVESPLVLDDGLFRIDLDALERKLSGRERMVILCSPHNPGGRVWTQTELRALAEFCGRHDLILVSDEIHCDLVMPGHQHCPSALAAPEAQDRLVTMIATTKTFNIAGAHLGSVIIADPALRTRFARTHAAMGTSANLYGMLMAEAAYTDGEAWLAGLIDYLDQNRRLFDARINAIPGLRSMPLQATYLAWVDFSGTGMDQAQILARIEGQAQIATNHGPSFGAGGEGWLRFNLALPRSLLETALNRIEAAFDDLQ